MSEVVQNIPFKKRHGDIDLQGLKDAIDEAYKTYHVREYRKKTTFSPSTLGFGKGRCPRYWYIAFDGAEFVDEPDARSVANMKNGTLAHERLDELFRRSPLEVIDSEREILAEDPPLRGFGDIILSYAGEEVVGEFKTSGHSGFMWKMTKMEASGYNIIQVLLYLWATDNETGLLIYESKDTHQLLIIPVFRSDHEEELQEMLEWMRTVRKSWEERKLPERPYRSNSKVCKQCPVREACFEEYPRGDVKIETLRVLW